MRSPLVTRTFNFIYLLVVLSTVKYELFSVHPIAMTLVWIAMSEGVLRAKQSKSSHGTMMIFAGICSVVGISVIYKVKEDYQEPHLQSMHSIYGFTAAICALVQIMFGMYAHGRIKTKLLWKIHATNGLLMFLGIGFVSWLQIGHTQGWLFHEQDGGMLAMAGRMVLTISIIINALG